MLLKQSLVMYKMAGSVFKAHILRSIQYILEEELVLEVFSVVTYFKTQVVATKNVSYIKYATVHWKERLNVMVCFLCSD